jgi:hypothetical protein
MNQILYVGAGVDLRPIQNFTNTKKFIYVDTLPRSTCDEINYLGCGFRSDLYSENFMISLFDECTRLNFELVSFQEINPEFYKKIFTPKQRIYYSFHPKKIPTLINPHVITFVHRKTQQTLKYYLSTNIEKNMNVQLSKDIIACDSIFISENIPSHKVLEYFQTPKIYIGYINESSGKKRNYDNDVDYDEYNNIVVFLHNNPIHVVSKYFTSYYLVCEQSNILIPCRNIRNLEYYQTSLSGDAGSISL